MPGDVISVDARYEKLLEQWRQGLAFKIGKLKKIANNFVLKTSLWAQDFESHYLEANVATDMGGNET